MRHIPDGVLRRLHDEPLAVPDRVDDHVAGCERCGSRRAEIAVDADRAGRLISAPQLAPDLDVAWARFQRGLASQPSDDADVSRPPVRGPARRPSFPSVSLRAGLTIGAAGVVVAGTAAAASFTTVFAPTHIAPIALSRGDVQAIAAFTGLGDGQALGSFSTPTGSSTLRFGTLTWSSGRAQPASSLAQAADETGLAIRLPAHLPPGVGAVPRFDVAPRMKAVVTFNATAGGLAGSSVTLDAGPGVVAEYGGTSGTSGADVPTLGVVTVRRPTARSSGATTAQIEAFLLSQPGIPPELAEEIRLLGNLRTTLPVPVPSGASIRSIQVAGRPGVLLTDSSKAASAVVWEDGEGLLHAVAGILDPQDVLSVADQVD